MAIQLTTKNSALNVFTADGLSYDRIATSASVSTDLDFKFKDGVGFVSLHKVAHYHSGTRYVLGDQLAAMVTATSAEASRATAAEQKVAADLATESSRAVAAEAKVSADLAMPAPPWVSSWPLSQPKCGHCGRDCASPRTVTTNRGR